MHKNIRIRQTVLPFALPDLDEAELAQVREVLESGWITSGEKTRCFENAFAKKVNAKYAIAVNSCTAAMHLALESIGLKKGDEVITSPYTFAATAEVIRYFNARPVFVDICSDNLNIDTQKISAAISNRTKAIIPVHIAGLPADLEAIYEIAETHNLAVIEDAAHAFPASYNESLIGSAPNRTKYYFPHAVAFSFYATKPITTAEGGMIVTDSKEIAERARIMSLHGINKDAWKRYMADGSWYYEIVAPGFKYNMPDIAAAIGLAQLDKAKRMWRRRYQIASEYNRAFKSLRHFTGPLDIKRGNHAWHLYMLRLNTEQWSGLNKKGKGSATIRNRFIQELLLRNISASVHFIPLHIHPYYRKIYGYQPEDYPVAYNEYLREISLPIYSKMNDDDVKDVIRAVIDILEYFG